jgi:hypothetical protein
MTSKNLKDWPLKEISSKDSTYKLAVASFKKCAFNIGMYNAP